ncbi:hypothetical protein B0H14DRAFT_3439177 [Mycena olivaceomarginata]|nr:hypothetical protein B0H14DRAFT_3439177 [Mycena olivaceomarginata]
MPVPTATTDCNYHRTYEHLDCMALCFLLLPHLILSLPLAPLLPPLVSISLLSALPLLSASPLSAPHRAALAHRYLPPLLISFSLFCTHNLGVSTHI